MKSFLPETVQQIHLIRLMGDISEDHWSAGWNVDLEYVLWNEINRVNAFILTKEEIASLRAASSLADGWGCFPDKGLEAHFVSLDEWRRHLSEMHRITLLYLSGT